MSTEPGAGHGDVAIYKNYPWTVLSAQQSWLQSNADTVKGLIRAFAKAQRYVRENPEGSRTILRAVFPRIDEKAFLAACNRNFPSVAQDPSVKLDGIASSFAEFNILNKGEALKVTPDQIATNKYVEDALR